MNSITIRNLDPAIEERPRARAAEHGHSMEAEARLILHTVLEPPACKAKPSLYERIHDRFVAVGGVDLELPPREPTRTALVRLMLVLATDILSAKIVLRRVQEVATWILPRVVEQHIVVAAHPEDERHPLTVL
jgi:antitoxin FitA